MESIMFISYKNANNQILQLSETEWFCRAVTKGLDSDKYWTWLATITDEDGEITYPSETFTIVEVTDEDIGQRLKQLSAYIQRSNPLGQLKVYNIKWSDSKVSAVTGQDMEGEDITIQTHFSGDDTTKDARLLADKWTAVRRQRDRKIAETDYLALSDSTLADNMTTYRQALRDVPSQADPDNITWPTKP
jgi:hypothetical protein